MGAGNPPIRILMFPWLAHGHIFPYLELAKSILQRKRSHIYFCTTAVNFSSIQDFIDRNELNDSVELVQLHFSDSELPPHYHTTKNLPSRLNFTLLKALQSSHSSFSDIIATVLPDLVIYDVFQPWAAKVARKQGVPAVYFSIFGAALLAYVHHQFTFGRNSGDFPSPTIRFQGGELRTLEILFDFLYENVHDIEQEFLFGTFKESCEVVLVKTSRGIEGKCVDYLSTLSHKKILPVGSLTTASGGGNPDSDVIKWLNTRTPSSTIFISFGSEYFLSREEIQEIAKGLEISGVCFIWIIRFPVGATMTLEEALPDGFLDRVRGRGKILTGWAPQADILAHENTGGFVSHCGWSSVMESMYFGVPVVAMAMKLDQPINARMLVEAGSCVEVFRSENEGFKGVEIAAAMMKVVVEEGGKELRRRARELSEKVKMEQEQVLDEVAEKLWELCLKHKNS